MSLPRSRRRFLRAVLSTTALGAVDGAAAGASNSDRTTIGRDASVVPRTPGNPNGFVPSWSTTFVKDGTTYLEDVARRVDGSGVVATGTTQVGDDRGEDRLWVAAFGPDGVVWSTLVGENIASDTQNVVVDGNRYVIFRDRPDGEYSGTLAATTVSADGNVLSTTTMESTYSWVRDVVVEDDRFLLLGPGTVVSVSTDFTAQAELLVPEPDGYEAGSTSSALVPVDDGYVLTGRVLSEETDIAYWAVKIDDPSGDVQWNRTFPAEDSVSAFGAAHAGDGRVIMVGERFQSERRQAAIAVDADGSLAWETVLGETTGAQFQDAVPVDGGVRAFGFLNYEEPNVVTFDRDGSVRSRWRERVGFESRQPRSVVAAGEDRYLVGGETESVSGGVEKGAWLMRLQPNQPPSPSVAVTPSSPNATEEVTFNAGGTTDPDTAVESYEWNLDDDEYAEEVGETMSTTFAAAGEYDVTLRALDVYGAVGKTTVSTSVGENTAPSASLSASPSEPFPGDEVQLAAAEVSDAETSVESVAWDLDGDGEVEVEGDKATTTFDAPGEYEVAVTLADTAGKTATVSTTVTVREPTETPTPTETRSPTATTVAETAAGGDATSGESGPTPGFGVGAGLAGLSAGALARLLRRD